MIVRIYQAPKAKWVVLIKEEGFWVVKEVVETIGLEVRDFVICPVIPKVGPWAYVEGAVIEPPDLEHRFRFCKKTNLFVDVESGEELTKKYPAGFTPWGIGL